MERETQHALFDLEILSDSNVKIGTIMVHPETLWLILQNPSHPFSLRAGEFELGLAIYSRIRHDWEQASI